MRLALPLVLASFIAAGCVSRINVRKIDPDTPIAQRPRGQIYYLPDTLIVTNFDKKTGMQLTYEAIPDEDSMYAVDGAAFMSTYGLGVGVDGRGLLDSVYMKSDSSGLAKESVGLGRKFLEEREKKTEERRTEEEAEREKIDGAEKAIREKKDAIRLKEEYIEDLTRLGASSSTILNERFSLANMRNELRLLEEQYAALAGTAPSQDSQNRINGMTDTSELPGPAIYRIEQVVDEQGHAKSVKLVRVAWPDHTGRRADQPHFPTSRVPLSKPRTAAQPVATPATQATLTAHPEDATTQNGRVLIEPKSRTSALLAERKLRLLARRAALEELDSQGDPAALSAVVVELADVETDIDAHRPKATAMARAYSNQRVRILSDLEFVPADSAIDQITREGSRVPLDKAALSAQFFVEPAMDADGNALPKAQWLTFGWKNAAKPGTYVVTLELRLIDGNGNASSNFTPHDITIELR